MNRWISVFLVFYVAFLSGLDVKLEGRGEWGHVYSQTLSQQISEDFKGYYFESSRFRCDHVESLPLGSHKHKAHEGQGEACHNCHFGHCSFVVLPARCDFGTPEKNLLLSFYLEVYSSPDLHGLFRPPIGILPYS